MAQVWQSTNRKPETIPCNNKYEKDVQSFLFRDLCTIRENLKKAKIEPKDSRLNTVSNFCHDLILIVQNAILFNPPKHSVHDEAIRLGNRLLTRYFPALRRNLAIPFDMILCVLCGSSDHSQKNQIIMCDRCCLWYCTHFYCCITTAALKKDKNFKTS